jgi:GNAT superfamily N-acetyltransferase
MMIREQLSPKKNPLFEHAEAALFTAWKDGALVGRVSASIDQEHLKRYQDALGFFGFFDTIDDPEVARALLQAAEAWLKSRGMHRMRGPLSMSINEEVGLLVEGFDTPPMLLMSHSRAYQGALAEACGLEKAKDLLAWRYHVAELPERAQKAAQQIAELPEVKIRTGRTSELGVILDIQDDAWRDNWGHVSLTPAELDAVAAALKLIINEDLTIIAEIDGEAAGMCIALPNLNDAIRDLDGKLLPFGWAKLLWRLKMRRPRTGRVLLMGIRTTWRRTLLGSALILMVLEALRRGLTKEGLERIELSWVLEDNLPMRRVIESIGGRISKTDRIFEKSLV